MRVDTQSIAVQGCWGRGGGGGGGGVELALGLGIGIKAGQFALHNQVHFKGRRLV